MIAESRTNQIFTVIPDADLLKLKENFTFSVQERVDATHTMVRFCTSWASKKENVQLLCKAIEEL
jgi:threonine aldolase